MDAIGYLGEGARLAQPPARALTEATFARELQAARWLWTAMGFADMAHVHELVRAGVLEPTLGRRLLGWLLEFHHDTPLERVGLDPAVGDTYNNRDRLLRERFGPEIGHLHAARARREATTLAWHLVVRSSLLDGLRATGELLAALLDVATAHRDTILPDTTYLQHAQPTSLAHYLLGHAHPVARDLDRFATTLALVNRSPAGAGSVNGSRFPIDRRRLATLLAFDDVVVHTRDAMWAPDLAQSVLATTTIAMTPIDRIAEELQLWATAEYGFVALADRHARTSVIMPQKKNPYSLAMVRGHAREMVGDLVAVAATQLTPSGQPDNRTAAYDRVPSALHWHAGSARLLADVLRGLEVDRERMRAAATTGFAYGTDICDLLVERTRLDNRTIHRIVGRAVREAMAAGRADLSGDDLEDAADRLGLDLPPVDHAAIARLREPEYLLSLRTEVGGAATVDAMLADLREVLARQAVPDDHPVATFEERFLATITRAAAGATAAGQDDAGAHQDPAPNHEDRQ